MKTIKEHPSMPLLAGDSLTVTSVFGPAAELLTFARHAGRVDMVLCVHQHDGVDEFPIVLTVPSRRDLLVRGARTMLWRVRHGWYWRRRNV